MSEQDGATNNERLELLAFQERLRVERERLGLSQEVFANLGGVGKSSQWLYEQGRHWPTMEYMESLRRHRVDVGYLATGLKLDWDSLRHALSFVLRLAQQEGRRFSDEQLFSVFRAAIEAASGATRNDLVDRMDYQPKTEISEAGKR